MPNPTAAMLVIGDEILSGRTRDANLYYLAGELNCVGIDLKEARIVSDDQAAIVEAVNALRTRYDHIFTSGGIGPTHDDITADAIGAAFKVPVDVRDDALAILFAHYNRSGTDLNEARMRMARIPQGAKLIENPVSAAPGFILENVHVMAGVPQIFNAMLAGVLPSLTGGAPLLSRTLRVDLPEGDIAGPLADVAKSYPQLSFGSYPFVQQGKYGSHIVIRGLQNADVSTALGKLQSLFGGEAQ